MSAPKSERPWILNVDFFDLEDFQLRFASQKEALAQCEVWMKQGFVSTARPPREDLPLAQTAEDPARREVHKLVPLGAVKEFTVSWHPESKK